VSTVCASAIRHRVISGEYRSSDVGSFALLGFGMGEFLAPKIGEEPEGGDCIVAVTTSWGGITETSRSAGL